MPPPMKRLPPKACSDPIVGRLTTNSAMAEAKMAGSRDSNDVGKSYCTEMGKRKASIPT